MVSIQLVVQLVDFSLVNSLQRSEIGKCPCTKSLRIPNIFRLWAFHYTDVRSSYPHQSVMEHFSRQMSRFLLGINCIILHMHVISTVLVWCHWHTYCFICMQINITTYIFYRIMFTTRWNIVKTNGPTSLSCFGLE